MQNPYEQEFGKFEALLQSWGDIYRYAVISLVALKSDGKRQLLFARVFFEPTLMGIDRRAFSFETEHVIARRFLIGPRKFNCGKLLATARVGKIIDGRRRDFVLVSGQNLSAYFDPIHHPMLLEGPRLPSLQIRGASKYNVLAAVGNSRQLDWELKAASKPFDGIDELLTHCGLPTLAQMGESASLELIARSPGIILGESKIENGKATIMCRTAKAVYVRKFKVGYKIFTNQSTHRGKLLGAGMDWRSEKDTQIGTCQVPVGEASLLLAYLSYSGSALHQWWITDPNKRLNPRHAIHQIFDDDLKLLRDTLFKADSRAFEESVSSLLNLLGYSISNYGRIPKLQQGPDIIAITPLGHVAVVECTIGLLNNNDKLAKLVQRTKLIRDKLNETGYSAISVQPVIVTMLQRAEVVADLPMAAQHNIAVVCRENLEEALTRVTLPLNADRLYEDGKRLIPRSDQRDFFRS